MKMLTRTEREGRAAQPRRRCGRTPSLAIPELSEVFGLRHLLVKDESVNPFGTHKDRKSEYLVLAARRGGAGRRPDAFSIITSGNAGVSLAAFASRDRIPVVAVVDALPEESMARLRRSCRDVLRVDLSSRVWTGRALRSLLRAHGYERTLDASNCAAAYAGLAHELAELGPDVVVLPVGSGELFVGLARVIRARRLLTRLYGVTVSRRDSIADKLAACWTPYWREIEALTRDPATGHRLFAVDDEEGLRDTYMLVRRYVRCEPSSALAFHLLRRCTLKASARVVVLNTGTVRAPAAGNS
jgi:cysteine synthase